MIRGAGGIAVLAHPFTLGIEKSDELSQLLGELGEMGLEGVEVYYPAHTEEMAVLYEEVAKRLGLVCTGGSDFHGNFRNHSYLGKIRQGQYLDYGLLQSLRERLKERNDLYQ